METCRVPPQWFCYFCSLRGDVTALLHEGPNSKPEWIQQAELVLQHIWLIIAGVWVVPLIGAEPADKYVHLLGQEVAALLHEWADGKPHAVQEGELVLQVIRVRVTRVRVLPFIRREPATQTPGASWEVCKQNLAQGMGSKTMWTVEQTHSFGWLDLRTPTFATFINIK